MFKDTDIIALEIEGNIVGLKKTTPMILTSSYVDSTENLKVKVCVPAPIHEKNWSKKVKIREFETEDCLLTLFLKERKKKHPSTPNFAYSMEPLFSSRYGYGSSTEKAMYKINMYSMSDNAEFERWMKVYAPNKVIYEGFLWEKDIALAIFKSYAKTLEKMPKNKSDLEKEIFKSVHKTLEKSIRGYFDFVQKFGKDKVDLHEIIQEMREDEVLFDCMASALIEEIKGYHYFTDHPLNPVELSLCENRISAMEICFELSQKEIGKMKNISSKVGYLISWYMEAMYYVSRRFQSSSTRNLNEVVVLREYILSENIAAFLKKYLVKTKKNTNLIPLVMELALVFEKSMGEEIFKEKEMFDLFVSHFDYENIFAELINKEQFGYFMRQVQFVNDMEISIFKSCKRVHSVNKERAQEVANIIKKCSHFEENKFFGSDTKIPSINILRETISPDFLKTDEKFLESVVNCVSIDYYIENDRLEEFIDFCLEYNVEIDEILKLIVMLDIRTKKQISKLSALCYSKYGRVQTLSDFALHHANPEIWMYLSEKYKCYPSVDSHSVDKLEEMRACGNIGKEKFDAILTPCLNKIKTTFYACSGYQRNKVLKILSCYGITLQEIELSKEEAEMYMHTLLTSDADIVELYDAAYTEPYLNEDLEKQLFFETVIKNQMRPLGSMLDFMFSIFVVFENKLESRGFSYSDISPELKTLIVKKIFKEEIEEKRVRDRCDNLKEKVDSIIEFCSEKGVFLGDVNLKSVVSVKDFSKREIEDSYTLQQIKGTLYS